MLGGSVTGRLSLDAKTSCPDFDLSARAGSLTLERGSFCCLYARAGILALERDYHPSSISCAVWDARAWDWTLERKCVSAARAGS